LKGSTKLRKKLEAERQKLKAYKINKTILKRRPKAFCFQPSAFSLL
jgi:hypothetical protein